jgi:hypothetical protein
LARERRGYQGTGWDVAEPKRSRLIVRVDYFIRPSLKNKLMCFSGDDVFRNLGEQDEAMKAIVGQLTNLSLGGQRAEFPEGPESFRLEVAFAYNEGKRECMSYQLNLEAIVLQEKRGRDRQLDLYQTTGAYDPELREAVVGGDVTALLMARGRM